MACRLISLNELDGLEGLIEQHRLLRELAETLERQAAQFNTIDPGVQEPERLSTALWQDIAELLGRLLERVTGRTLE